METSRETEREEEEEESRALPMRAWFAVKFDETQRMVKGDGRD
jgi:hypothetical protein